VLVRRLDRASEHTAPSRGSNIALNSLARFALNDVFLIKIPSKGKKTIVSCMIKDVHVSILSFHQCQNARRKRSYVLAFVSTDAALEDASVGPEVHSFARIERACSKWPQSACKAQGGRLRRRRRRARR